MWILWYDSYLFCGYDFGNEYDLKWTMIWKMIWFQKRCDFEMNMIFWYKYELFEM